MTSDLFPGPKLKIKRAYQHIAELDHVLNTFLETDFYTFGVEKEPDSEDYVLKFKMTKPMPKQIPLIIGDAIHNMRSALDLLACDLVKMAGKTPSDFVRFPFRKDRKELAAALNGGQLKVAGADIVTLILDTIQPYPGGKGEPLWSLHRLDILDKHLLIIPVISVAALRHVNGKAGGIKFTDCTLIVANGGVLKPMAMPAPFEFEGGGQPTFQVLFDKGQFFEGKPVGPTLLELLQFVASAGYAIERQLLARGTSPSPG